MTYKVPEYVSKMLPQSYCVCGISLRPFSFGHYIILLDNQSPFVMPGHAYADEDDLKIVLAHCSRDWKENMEFLRDTYAMEDWYRSFDEQYPIHLMSQDKEYLELKAALDACD